MNSVNTVIGGVVVVILLFISYMLWTNGTFTPATGEPAATSTPTGGGDTVVITTPPTPTETAGLPGILTGQLVVPSNMSAVVTGYVAPNGAATTYWFDYGLSSSLTNRTTSKSAGGGFVTLATPAFINGLAANTTYSYRLSAQNNFGSVQGATYTFTTSANPPPTGTAPSANTNVATEVTRTTATLNGHISPGNAQTTYWFEYGTTQSFGTVSSFGNAGSGAVSLAVSIPLTSLASQTKYYYRLNAQNNNGTVSGAIQSFTTAGPATTGLPTVSTTAATNISTSTATFNGRVNPHNTASSYWFEYSTNPQMNDILGTISATQTLPAEATTNVSVIATSLTNNTRYYYRLVVRNPQGTTDGDPISFTTRR